MESLRRRWRQIPGVLDSRGGARAVEIQVTPPGLQGYFIERSMKRLMLWVIAIVAASGSVLFAQDAVGTLPPKAMAADANPAFEVATIKASQFREAGGTFRVSPGGLFNATNFPMTVLIQFAYNVPRRQIS